MSKLSNEQLELIQLILEQGFIYSTFVSIDDEYEYEFRVDSIRIFNGFVLITTDYEDFYLNNYKNTWGLKKGNINIIPKIIDNKKRHLIRMSFYLSNFFN